MRQKRNVPVLQAERVCSLASSFVIGKFNNFAFSEMVASTVRTKLLHLAGKFMTEVANFKVPLHTNCQSVASFIVSNMERIFAPLSPFSWNSQLIADIF